MVQTTVISGTVENSMEPMVPIVEKRMRKRVPKNDDVVYPMREKEQIS